MLDSDYEHLDKALARKKAYKYADVAHRLEKVAFDVVMFKDADGLDKLWQIQDVDGEKVIIAMYEDEEPLTAIASTPWSAVQDNRGRINVFYKGEPISKFAAEELGIPEEDNSLVCRYLPEKLASDAGFRAMFLSDLPNSDRKALAIKYPELRIV